MSKREKWILTAFLFFCCVATAIGVQVLGYQDLQIISAPGNPPSGFLRFSAQTGTLGCKTSSGGNCLSGLAPGGTAGGDLSGTYPNPSVAGLSSVPFCSGYTPTNGQVITYTTGGSPNPCYTAGAGGGFANPMTMAGDLIDGGSSGTPQRLGIGSSGNCLVVSAGAPAWGSCTAGGGGGLTQIGQAIVGGSSSGVCSVTSGTVTCSSIPATYTNLRLACSGRVSDSAAVEAIGIEINTDNASNYDKQNVSGTESTAAAAQTLGNPPSGVGAVFGLPGASATANYSGAGEVTFFGYAQTSLFKNYIGVPMYAGSAANFTIFPIGLQWHSTSAINEIQAIDEGGGNFSTGTICTLYGVQ